MNSTKSLRLLALTLLAAVAVLALASNAAASQRQLSSVQDDAELLGGSAVDPAVAMAELRDLGVDVVRTNIPFFNVYQGSEAKKRPTGFDASDPSESRYEWGRWDRLIDLAEQNGIQVLATLSGPGPAWASQSPSVCSPTPPCTFRPKPAEFGKFVAAAAKRYRGRIDYYSLYNEPNLKEWITPQQTRPGRGVQTEAVIYRKHWRAGYKSIARHDPARRNRVLFGEVAAIGEPLSLMRAALCLDERGRPFRGKLKRKHGCKGKAARLNIGGFAIHPYNPGAYGTPRSRLKGGRSTSTSLPLAYLPRMHRVINQALRARQIRRRAPIYITEFGFQTKPPDRFGSSPKRQAQYINESDRLFWGDPRVAMVSQYELTDVDDKSVFNTGLRFNKGRRKKPSYDAYRLPLVVTRRSSRSVEVWGQVRPGGRATVQLQAKRGKAKFRRVRNVKTNGRGYFRVNVKRKGASGLRYRLSWQDPDGDFHTSRVARAGKRLRYYRN